MKAYHVIWLKAHPERSRDWLQKQLQDGFDIHHVDCDHSNNHPANLVLMDGIDHMRLHGMFKMARPDRREAVRKASVERWAKASQKERTAHAKKMANARWKRIRAQKAKIEAVKVNEGT